MFEHVPLRLRNCGSEAARAQAAAASPVWLHMSMETPPPSS
jgi:hypothetical protein